ncbi:MAG: hypothetical protein GXO50_01340 [Chlorobi bacterium]|nr:hypothetical protein [Chlorobiota bacterium]
MKTFKLLSFILLLSTVSCDLFEDNEYDEYPDCVTDYIDYWSKSENSNSAFVKEYEYNGQTVYLLGAVFTDDTDKIYNESCEMICERGGLTGTDTCSDWENAIFIKTIWTKE